MDWQELLDSVVTYRQYDSHVKFQMVHVPFALQLLNGTLPNCLQPSIANPTMGRANKGLIFSLVN